MTYKHWSDDEEWESPECDTPLDLIKQAANLPFTTTLVCPDFSSLNLDKLATDLTHLPSHYIPPDKMKTWEDLIRKLMESATAGLTVTTRHLPQLASLTTTHTPAIETPRASSSLLPTSIRKLVDKSYERPAVSVCVSLCITMYNYY